MSVKKSKGQEVVSVLLDLQNQQLYSHGHLYVALRRIPVASKFAILTKAESTMLGQNREIITTATNIVYPEPHKPVGIIQPIEEMDKWESYGRFQASVSDVSKHYQDAQITFEKAWNTIIAHI